MREIGEECIGGALIAQKFSGSILHKIKLEEKKIGLLTYLFKDIDRDNTYLFEDLRNRFQLESIN